MLSEKQKQKMVQAICDHVDRYGDASFVEILRICQPIGDINGKHVMTTTIDHNVILWERLSQEFVSLLLDLVKSQVLFPHPTSFLVYALDGFMTDTPIAQKLSPKGYSKPHWLPVVFKRSA